MTKVYSTTLREADRRGEKEQNRNTLKGETSRGSNKKDE